MCIGTLVFIMFILDRNGCHILSKVIQHKEIVHQVSFRCHIFTLTVVFLSLKLEHIRV